MRPASNPPQIIGYGNRWVTSMEAIGQPITEAEARRAHERGKRYAVVLRDPLGLIQISFLADTVAVAFPVPGSDTPRTSHVWQREGDRLLVVEAGRDNGDPTRVAPTKLEHEFMTFGDGTATWGTWGDEIHKLGQREVDTDLCQLGRPAFGDYTSLCDRTLLRRLWPGLPDHPWIDTETWAHSRTLEPVAARLAAAARAVNDGSDAGADTLRSALAADEDVFLPTTPDGAHPLARMTDGQHHLSAFTERDTLQWAWPDRPALIRTTVGQALDWAREIGLPVRVDADSDRAVNLDPATVSALAEGATVDLSPVAVGAPHRRPGPAAAIPSGPPPPPLDIPDPAVSYGRAWDPTTHRLVNDNPGETLDPTAARARHDTDERYAAVVADGSSALAVERSAGWVVARAYDPHGRLTDRTTWRRIEDRLFAAEVAVHAYQSGPQDGPTLSIVSLCRPDGVSRTWTAVGPDDAQTEDRHTDDTSGWWMPETAFGTYRALLAAPPG